MKRFMSLLAVLLAALLSFTLGASTQVARAAGSDIVETATDADFKSYIAESNKKPVIFMVSTTWCGYCKKQWPLMVDKNKADGGSWKLVHIEVDLHAQAKAFFASKGYPDSVAYSDGKEMSFKGPDGKTVGRLYGYYEKPETEAWINKIVDQWKKEHPGGNDPKPTPTPTVKPTETPKPTPSPTVKPTETPKPTPTVKPTESTKPQPVAGEVEVTNANFREVLAKSSEQPVVVLVGATWSKLTQSTLEKYRAKLNADKNFLLARVDGDKYKEALGFFGVKGYPTLMGYSDNKEMSNPARYANGGYSQEQVNGFVDAVVSQWKKEHAPSPSPTVKPTEDGTLPELPPGAVQITSMEEFQKKIVEESKKRPVILDFSKDQCEGCLLISPILEKKYVADKGAWQLGRIDGTQVQDVWKLFDNPWFPTLIAFRDGKEVGRYSGYDGKDQPVVDFIDKVVRGENPGGDPLVVDLKDNATFDQVKAISQRHPVALRFHIDKYSADSAAQGEVASKMAQGDGGKWTLANVDMGSPFYIDVASAVGKDLMGAPATMVIFYQGKARTEEELKVLRQPKADEAGLRAWVNAMLSHHYKG